MSEGYFKIKPAGRHILTIGRDLIQDPYAAVVELVKNAYDADAQEVRIEFKKINQEIQIIVSDDGHGMTNDVVVNKWMVPSTDDKLLRRESPGHRIMQGRKGIGRYAASILGSDLLLETIAATEKGKEKTSIYVQWDAFEKAQYLEDVDVLIDSEPVESEKGTILTIRGGEENLQEWTEKQFNKLIFELKKLKPPVEDDSTWTDRFNIFLSVKNFDVISDFKTKIEPYPLFKLYDYKISGIIDKTGDGILNYSMQRARNTVAEQIPFSYGKPTKCGKVVFDIRVFDREADSIDQLIKRGLKDDGGNYVGKLEARHLLDEYNGIGVYRNGFRIRPLGDADFDWLKLNEKRIQNPSRKIGSNQVIGIVKIENEESSGLIEKSARDGLKENQAYIDLADLTEEVIIKLETRRFDYRKKAGLSRSALKIESEFEKLFSFDSLKKNVRRSLAKGNVNKNISDDVLKVIDDSEKEKNQLANSIREAVAVYQGQATLGKIINVILHEGRKPLNFFKNQIPILDFYYDEYRHGNSENFPAIFETLKNMSSNSDVLIKLFEKIDPLATGRRGKRKKINLLKEIKSIFSIFDIELKDVKVSATTDNGKDVFFTCWRQDIYSIFTNLIENSIYWLNVKECRNKQIYIIINCTDDNIEFIDYRDTGPGIEPSLIESGIIFEPEFSTKPEGTGLGLSIAGEAAKRCGFSLEALSSDTGAYFRLQRIGGNE